MNQADRPPLGIMPRYIHLELRRKDIIAAIRRYLDAEIKVPAEWVEEVNEITEWLRAHEKQSTT